MISLARWLAMSGIGLVLLMDAAIALAEPLTFYVSAGGSDSRSGRLADPNPAHTDGPFASIRRAQEAVRELHKQGTRPGPVTVRIRGNWRLAAPIVFTPDDSSTAESPVVYTGYPGEKPLVSDGRVIRGWRRSGPGQVWTVELPDVKAGQWYFRQLFVNGRRACRARSPNTGNFRVEGLVDPQFGAEWNQGVDKFRFQPGDIQAWNDLNNVEVVVFHSWNTSRVRIASVDTAQAVVAFTGPTIFRSLAWDPSQRYYVDNIQLQSTHTGDD